MHYKSLGGREVADAVLHDAKRRIEQLGRKPKLAIVMIGENEASKVYVDKKLKAADSIGMTAELYHMPTGMSQPELLKLVDKLNKDKSIDGFIVQLPLPMNISAGRVISAIDPKKDVDGLHALNMGKLVLGLEDHFPPATPAGIMKMLDFYDIGIAGKNAVVVGRSNMVGKPIAFMLLNSNATVEVCHSRTKDLGGHTSRADILVVAVGKPGLITADMVKEGAYVIDVGTTKVEGKLKGDVDYDSVIKKAHCTPVPGGVGPLTVAMLISNTVTAAEDRK